MSDVNEITLDGAWAEAVVVGAQQKLWNLSSEEQTRCSESPQSENLPEHIRLFREYFRDQKQYANYDLSPTPPRSSPRSQSSDPRQDKSCQLPDVMGTRSTLSRCVESSSSSSLEPRSEEEESLRNLLKSRDVDIDTILLKNNRRMIPIEPDVVFMQRLKGKLDSSPQEAHDNILEEFLEDFRAGVQQCSLKIVAECQSGRKTGKELRPIPGVRDAGVGLLASGKISKRQKRIHKPKLRS